jgi:hypothetical protein
VLHYKLRKLSNKSMLQAGDKVVIDCGDAKEHRHLLQFHGRHAVVQETNVYGSQRCSVSIADVKRDQSLPSSVLKKLPAAEAAASPVVLAADNSATTSSAAKITRQSSKRRATDTSSNGNGAAQASSIAAAKRNLRLANTPASQHSHSEAAADLAIQDAAVAVPLDDVQVSESWLYTVQKMSFFWQWQCVCTDAFQLCFARLHFVLKSMLSTLVSTTLCTA